MLLYALKRLLHVIPVTIGVSIVCFMLIHIAPGDPLAAILPSDASAEMQAQMRAFYGLDRPLPVQYALWLWHALQGDLGTSIATGRPVLADIVDASINSIILALSSAVIGFIGGATLGFLAGVFRGGWIDRLSSGIAMLGVSVPHYWLGMVLVIAFSVTLGWLPAMGGGPGGSSGRSFSWEYFQYLVLPAITMSVIPMGIIARTIRSLVADILAQDFTQALAAKGLMRGRILRHVVRNAAPTALSVMGLQLGYLLGGSILIETVFSWPGTGFLLNGAIFTRDLPILQGTILVLAMFFVFLNLVIDVLQSAIDPRIQRS
ncbi:MULTISPECIES: ABC transporter permease [Agrobacterium]|uniref:ABC transporter permease n=1 Tax=Agrobacterium tumefaciens TaxID=358 RepID=A0AAE6BEE5_AGRTU|nr:MULTISPECIES: ABC transporter permease [Agrobacterium]QCL75853.1 ABC transporter permease [Agrobacterium tumefaciens]QCL81413.1 ABC transporter permease [Agrobacterium tumefaciens]WCK04697.1 ABC transporter permease [Agrobacterium tumefaciens]CUX53818.1 Putative Oligopeptide ABC transporter (permease protein) [Agrobacterium sp. NCPPB 925]